MLSGASWGGYLTLLGLGLQPERWALGVAGVPVADYVAAFEDGDGAPQGIRPSAFRRGAGREAKALCRAFTDHVCRLIELGKPHEFMRYDAGHGSLRTDERIRQMEAELDFVARHLGTAPPL